MSSIEIEISGQGPVGPVGPQGPQGPAGATNLISMEDIVSPLLSLPLLNGITMPHGVGSATFTRERKIGFQNRYGYLEFAASDVPAFNENGYISNKAAANVLDHDDLTDWTGTDVVATANATGPDNGANTAFSIVAANNSNAKSLSDTASLTSGTPYTPTVWVKKGNWNYCKVELSNSTDGVLTTANFDVNAGTTPTSGASLIEYNDGWYRLVLPAGTPTATETGTIKIIPCSTSSYTGTDAGDGSTANIYVAYPQINTTTEALFYADRTYLTAPALTVPYDDNVPNPAENCSIIASVSLFEASTNQYMFYVGTDWYAKFESGAFVVKWGDATISATPSSVDRYCVTFDGATVSVYFDGTLQTAGTVTTPPSGPYSTISIAQGLTGTIKNFKIFNKCLTADEVEVA